MSHTEGLIAIEAALRCVEQQEDTTATNLLLLRRLRNIAAKKSGELQLNKTVNDFFYESLK
jgi:hypothetical protein